MMTPTGGNGSALTAVFGAEARIVVTSDTNASKKPTRRRGLVGVAMRYHARWSQPLHGGGLSRLALVLQRLSKLKPFPVGRECLEID